MGKVRNKKYSRELFEKYYLAHAQHTKYKRYICMRVIKAINEMALEHVLAGKEYIFPSCMGSMMIVGKKYTPFYFKGKLIFPKPVDWKATYQLRSEDEEFRKEKKVVRYTSEYIYRFGYKPSLKGPTASGIMRIKPTPTNRKRLSELIKENKLIAYTKEYEYRKR